MEEEEEAVLNLLGIANTRTVISALKNEENG